jgi:hypothetical protein
MKLIIIFLDQYSHQIATHFERFFSQIREQLMYLHKIDLYNSKLQSCPYNKSDHDVYI